MKIGYARVSTLDQSLRLQVRALQEFGCDQIYQEKKSAAKERPELELMVDRLRKGDTVVVWKLDRLGRSLKHLVDLVNEFKDREVEFVSLTDNINTTTAQGRLVFNLFGSFAEFERELISERTKAGLRNAREKGHFAGRKPGLTDKAKDKARTIYKFHCDPEYSVSRIRKMVGVSKATYYRYKEWAEKEAQEKREKRKPVEVDSEEILCSHCGNDPGTKEGSIVWNGFLDKDTGEKVCFNCKDLHYYKKFKNPDLAGLFTEFPITIKNPLGVLMEKEKTGKTVAKKRVIKKLKGNG